MLVTELGWSPVILSCPCAVFKAHPFSTFVFLPGFAHLRMFTLSSYTETPGVIEAGSLFPVLIVFTMEGYISVPGSFDLQAFYGESAMFLTGQRVSFAAAVSGGPYSTSSVVQEGSLQFLVLIPRVPSSTCGLAGISPIHLMCSRGGSF